MQQLCANGRRGGGACLQSDAAEAGSEGQARSRQPGRQAGALVRTRVVPTKPKAVRDAHMHLVLLLGVGHHVDAVDLLDRRGLRPVNTTGRR